METTDSEAMFRLTPRNTGRGWPPLRYSFSIPTSSISMRFRISGLPSLLGFLSGRDRTAETRSFRSFWLCLFWLGVAGCAPDTDPGGEAQSLSSSEHAGGQASDLPGQAQALLEPPERGEGSEASSLSTPEAPAEGVRVLFVGTSLTEGLGLDRPDLEAWPAQVGALAAAGGYQIRVRNAGLSGETSAGALRRLDWILSGDPFDIFVLETGANDGLRGLPLDDLEDNLNAILARVRQGAPEAQVILAGMEAPPNLGPAYTEQFRAIFPRVAARWDAALIPFLLEGVAGEPSLNQADRIHPTAEGQARMAQVAWPVLESLLAGLEDATP